jgi:hypothetical protein
VVIAGCVQVSAPSLGFVGQAVPVIAEALVDVSVQADRLELWLRKVTVEVRAGSKINIVNW